MRSKIMKFVFGGEPTLLTKGVIAILLGLPFLAAYFLGWQGGLWLIIFGGLQTTFGLAIIIIAIMSKRNKRERN